MQRLRKPPDGVAIRDVKSTVRSQTARTKQETTVTLEDDLRGYELPQTLWRFVQTIDGKENDPSPL